MISAATAPVYERLAFPAITALTLVLVWAAPNLLSLNVQLILLATLVVLIGLPHGALDPWLAQRSELVRNKTQAVWFNVLYVIVAGFVVLIWAWLPVASLAIFLSISAWHFSGDWHGEVSLWQRWVAGLMLLLMPIGFHTAQVAMLFAQLSGSQAEQLAQALALAPWLLVTVMMGLVALASWQRRWFAALEYFSLLVLAYLVAPLLYFALYFCALHSLRHLAGFFRQARAVERPRLLRITFAYSAMTVALSGLLWVLWSELPTDTVILRLVFIGLAAVTVPHMMLLAWVRFRGRGMGEH